MITALSVSGFPLDSFSFYGFAPRTLGERNNLWKKLKESNEEIFVLYESPKRIIKLLEELETEFPEANLSISRELTKLHEKTICGTITEIKEKLKSDENAERGEYVIIIQKNIPVGAYCIRPDRNTPEHILFDYIIEHKDATIKTAIEEMAKQGYSKKELYQAGIKLKEIIKR